MAQFHKKQINIDNINNAEEYVDGDGINAQAINEMVNGILYAQDSGTGGGGTGGVTLTNNDGDSTVNGFTQAAVKGVAQSKNYYNLGAYDTFVSNHDGTVTITRKTRTAIINHVIGKSGVQTANNVFYTEALECVLAPNSNNDIGNAVSSYGKTNAYNYFFNNVETGVSVTTDGEFGIAFGKTGITSIAGANLYLAQKPIFFEYQVKPEYEYTEDVIEYQPIHIASQEECLYWQKEFKKGLNLFDPDQFPSYLSNVQYRYDEDNRFYYVISTSSTNTAKAVQFKLNLEQGSYFIQALNTNGWFDRLRVYKEDENGTPIGGGVRAIMVKQGASFTFEAQTDENYYLVIYLQDNVLQGDYSPVDIMLNKGNHPYPYTPYNGKLIHQIDLDETENKITQLSEDTLNTTDDLYDKIEDLQDKIDEGKLISKYSLSGDYSYTASGNNITTSASVTIRMEAPAEIDNLTDFAQYLQEAGYTQDTPYSYIVNGDLIGTNAVGALYVNESNEVYIRVPVNKGTTSKQLTTIKVTNFSLLSTSRVQGRILSVNITNPVATITLTTVENESEEIAFMEATLISGNVSVGKYLFYNGAFAEITDYNASDGYLSLRVAKNGIFRQSLNQTITCEVVDSGDVYNNAPLEANELSIRLTHATYGAVNYTYTAEVVNNPNNDNILNKTLIVQNAPERTLEVVAYDSLSNTYTLTSAAANHINYFGALVASKSPFNVTIGGGENSSLGSNEVAVTLLSSTANSAGTEYTMSATITGVGSTPLASGTILYRIATQSPHEVYKLNVISYNGGDNYTVTCSANDYTYCFYSFYRWSKSFTMNIFGDKKIIATFTKEADLANGYRLSMTVVDNPNNVQIKTMSMADMSSSWIIPDGEPLDRTGAFGTIVGVVDNAYTLTVNTASYDNYFSKHLGENIIVTVDNN